MRTINYELINPSTYSHIHNFFAPLTTQKFFDKKIKNLKRTFVEKNNMEEAIKIIKEEIENRGLKILKIILFGSRARGDFKEDSDWDFLIVIDKDLDRRTKWDIIIKIKRKLAMLKIPNDIIINSIREFEERRDNVGYIIYYAVREGIVL
jgi:predicted nucleotidyltransferase